MTDSLDELIAFGIRIVIFRLRPEVAVPLDALEFGQIIRYDEIIPDVIERIEVVVVARDSEDVMMSRL